jgi:hypothetical protein
MNDTIYILIVKINRAFLGAYATRAEAEQASKAFKVPTEIFDWTMPVGFINCEYASCLTPGH